MLILMSTNILNMVLDFIGLRPFRFLVEDLLGFDEIVATPLCLGNISKDFSVNNMKKKELNGYVMILVLNIMLLRVIVC